MACPSGDFDSDGLQDTTFEKQWVATGASISEVNGGRDGAKHPTTFSLYAQDKYEKAGLIVNGAAGGMTCVMLIFGLTKPCRRRMAATS